VALVIGVDLGKKRDPTAICVASAEYRCKAGRDECHFVVRHLERLRLGTPYPRVAERIVGIAAHARGRASDAPTIFMDATGVGQPVVDLLREKAPDVIVIGVLLTHGDQRSHESPCEVRLGKAYLVSRLQSLFQTGRLHLPKTAEAQALAAELLAYEIRVDENAHDRYGAFKVGAHDDLVTALGLLVSILDHLASPPCERPGPLWSRRSADGWTSSPYSSCHLHHLYGGVWGQPSGESSHPSWRPSAVRSR
jgi:hypothetical protein